MTQTARLRRTRDFDVVYKKGRRKRSTHFVLIAWKNPEGQGLRFGLSVAKRLGNAVTRNRIRRRLREILRREEWGEKARGQHKVSWDVVIQPRTGKIARAELAPLREELTGLITAALKAS